MSDAQARSGHDARDGFRPDIEGLRAVAVGLVLLYHARVPHFAGGFVGVDVFFVVSGFLITGLLLRELSASGTISLPTFYARRSRRLLPAAALVLLVTLVASVLVLPALRVPDVAGDTAAAALYVSNMRFAFQATDYFAAELAPSPILHYWSLGVEEQFYLFWPAIVLLVTRRAADPVRRVGLAVAGISVVSFGLALWLTATAAPLAFFSLPTRAWELGLGAILAVAGTRLVVVPERMAAALGWIGLGLIGLAGVALDAATPFPGLAALLPTVGTALVIVSGSRRTAFGPARLLGLALPRFFGRISYSLYLWHWPLLVLPAAALGGPLPWWARGGLVLVAIAAATASQRWVEDPLRRGRLIGTLPRRNLALAGALTIAVAVTSGGIGSVATAGLGGAGASASVEGEEAALEGLLDDLESQAPATPGPGAATPTPGEPGATPTPGETGATPTPGTTPGDGRPATPDGPLPANLRPTLAASRGDYPAAYVDGCHAKQDDLSSGSCVYADRSSSTTIAIFGDSHALSWFPALERISLREGWRLLVLTKSACTPADVPVWNTTYKRVYGECERWRERTVDRLVAERPSIVLVTGTRGFRVVDSTGTVLEGSRRTRAWQAGMARTLDRLSAAAGRVVVVGDTPLSIVDPPECLSKHPSSTLACATPVGKAISATWLAEERRAADQAGAGFIDPSRWVCPSAPCPVVLGDFLIYRDPGHLTTPFSRALAGRLESALRRELATLP